MESKKRIILFFSLYFFCQIYVPILHCIQQQSIGNDHLAHHVLSLIPYHYELPSIMQANEWKELKLDLLVERLNQTKTSFGRWGLKKLLWPVADVQVITSRQKVIRQLLEDQDALVQVRQYLQCLQLAKDALLAYWNEHDTLHAQVKSLYYVIAQFKKPLNHSRLALELSMLFEWSKSLIALGKTLCFEGLIHELLPCLYGGSKEFHFMNGIKRGWSEPLRNNNPFLERSKNYNHTYQEFIYILINGTLGDRCKIFTEGYNHEISFKFPFLSQLNVETAAVKSFVDIPLSMKFFLQAFGISMALGYTTWYDIRLYRHGQDVVQRLNFLFKTVNQLHERLCMIAAFIRTAAQLHQYIINKQIMLDCNCTQQFEQFFSNNSTSVIMHKLLQILATPTFKKPTRLLYSRGRVLLAHKLLGEIKDELIPLLHAIAECDAYASITTTYNNHTQNTVDFCFAEFIQNSTPVINIEKGWTPIVSEKNASVNSFDLGLQTYPTKLIITGPNGCGKSTFLKALGQTIVMAQSWGIVPATHAQLTLMHGLKTCLVSQEDIVNGLSTFMVEDKRMHEIYQFLKMNPSDKPLTVLIDEPWRGTVDEASAQYIYQFGKDIAPMGNVVACIATHVKKPVELADEMNGIFGNVQVEIIPQDDGTFMRTFKIMPGAAHWWFDDSSLRSKFIRWLKILYGAQSL